MTTTTTPQEVDAVTIEAFESLNKWKNAASTSQTFPPRLVYQTNRSKAANKGFPSVLETGRKLGLTDHEVAALHGWTTGDYRLVNPIARGKAETEFEDYPLLPQDLAKVTFRLTRQDVLPYITLVQSALSKLPPQGNQVCWRGHPRSLKKEFVLEGFTSATLDREQALEFCARAKNSHCTTLVCFVQSTSGKSISRFSARPQEMEVLFLPDTKFRVVQPAPKHNAGDIKAVQQAINELQKKVPQATIELLYVKEV